MIKNLMKIFGGSKDKPSSDTPAASATPAKSSSSSSAPGSDGLKDLENFVDYIIRSLVDHPQDVKISIENKEDLAIIKIDCKKEDVGKVVGKKGKTIMAIRELVSGAGSRAQRKVTVEVID